MTFADFTATDLSAAGLVALAVLMVFLGQLVPRRVVSDIRSDRDARLAEARSEVQDWKTAYSASEEARALQAQQVGELLELAKTTDQFIRSLQLAAKRNET